MPLQVHYSFSSYSIGYFKPNSVFCLRRNKLGFNSSVSCNVLTLQLTKRCIEFFPSERVRPARQEERVSSNSTQHFMLRHHHIMSVISEQNKILPAALRPLQNSNTNSN